MRVIRLIILLFILFPFFATAQSDTVSANKAIQLAEEFIRINGYTIEQADTIKMQREFIYDDDLSTTTIVKNRNNTLQPKARYITEHDKEWHIGFLYTSEAINNYRKKFGKIKSKGRAVIVANNFSAIRMAHKSPLFDKWTLINK